MNRIRIEEADHSATVPGSERVRLYEDICARILAHPYVLCHRDFHGINLHIFNDSLYMIDYQDLRMGPDTYDVASLLRDRGVARILGPEAERELLEYYRDRVGAGKDLHHRYLETLLQRSLKILGTFAMQAVTRGRRHYLQWVEPTIESIRFCLEGLPEFRPLLDVFPLSPPMG